MEPGDLLFETLQLVVHEASLFAAVGFVILGLSDLALDLIWIMFAAKRRWRGSAPTLLADLAPARAPGRMAVFVPAWDEDAVIADMLRHAVAAFGEADYRLYVGCYPNDPDTIGAVRAVRDERIALVVGPQPGPTCKADNLNRLWDRMVADETAEGREFKAVILHDAEDVVHSAELSVFDSLIEHYDLVQLPVVPIADRASRWIAGHYLDEFAEAHGKQMVVRAALGAALPSAGVGCAISRAALAKVAAKRGAPFDTGSLTEDYELGLRLSEAGCRTAFVRLHVAPGRPVIATREHFPTTLDAAVAQKARWMTGIALAGWDRLGWGGGLAERWMRLRDRQSILAAMLVVAAYLGLLGEGVLVMIASATGRAIAPYSALFVGLVALATGLLLWRLIMRFAFVAAAHGLREALRSPVRALIGNAVSILAARRALGRYLSGRRNGRSVWDKTAHVFPRQVPAE